MRPVLIGVTYLAAGLIVGALVAGVGIALGGAGHGWISAGITSVAILTAPLTGLAWALRRRLGGRILAGLLVLAAVAANGGLVVSTSREGWGYAEDAWSDAPIALSIWFILWLSWQAVAALVLVRRPAREAKSA